MSDQRSKGKSESDPTVVITGSPVIVCMFTHLPLDDLLRGVFTFDRRLHRPEDDQQAAQTSGCGKLPGLEGGQQLTVPEADTQTGSQSTVYFRTTDQRTINASVSPARTELAVGF